MIEAFGEPTYIETSADDKVSTEWNLEFELADNTAPYIVGTIYDWKRYDAGKACRSGDEFEWHIGGKSADALELMEQTLDKVRGKNPIPRSYR